MASVLAVFVLAHLPLAAPASERVELRFKKSGDDLSSMIKHLELGDDEYSIEMEYGPENPAILELGRGVRLERKDGVYVELPEGNVFQRTCLWIRVELPYFQDEKMGIKGKAVITRKVSDDNLGNPQFADSETAFEVFRYARSFVFRRDYNSGGQESRCYDHSIDCRG
ncbi:MAG: hypothetical protein AAGD22_08005 [Verrucomicrobiota bacterium]